MKKNIILVLSIAVFLSSASVFAIENGWYWSKNLQISDILLERTNDGKVYCRVVTTSKDNNVKEWAFEVNDKTQTMVDTLGLALIHKRSVALRWKTNGSRKVNYEYRHGGGHGNINEVVAVAFRR